jgi:HPt (histidine-containing phosphotransfer) domain-containing protein
MHIQIDRLKEIAGDDRELIMSLFSLFLESYNKCLERMAFSLKNKADGDQIWHDAMHELKGSAYNIGFSDLGDFCTAAEKIDSLEQKEEAIKMLKYQLSEVEDFMENY